MKAGTTALEVLDGDAERALWQEHATQLWKAPGAIVRASWLPASIAAGLGEIEQMGDGIEIIGRAAIGAGLIRIDGDTGAQARHRTAARVAPVRQHRHRTWIRCAQGDG